MVALITGASGGIGAAMARKLKKQGHKVILAARNEEKLLGLQRELGDGTEIIPIDLSLENAPYQLYQEVKGKGVEILINNAGYGTFGEFSSVSLETEMNMLSLNVRTPHILTKLFLKDFLVRDRGYILNVGSMAGLLSGGPLLDTYYATKSYLVRLSEGIYEELRRRKSHVSISVLCPGPVHTGFNQRAGVRFAVSGITAEKAAECAIQGMFRRKLLIIPGGLAKAGNFFKRFGSEKFLLSATYHFQNRKNRE